MFIVTTASADPVDNSQAAEHAKAFDAAARAHYDLREYAAAVADYRRAFEALPDPLFLFDIAQAYRQLHDCDNARAFYRAYLRDLPGADNRSKVETFITEMNACAHDAAAPAPAPGRRGTFYAGVAAAAAGLVVVGTGVYFSFEASDRAHDLELQCATSCDGSAVASIDRAGHDANRNAIISYVAGGAAAAVGVALIAWSLHTRDEPTAVIVPVPGGAAGSITVRF
jgi:tetratricopeptide (TPR) repeat protein